MKAEDNEIKIMQLRAFCMIAERGTVSEAAEKLFRTQSAITRSIRDLEHTLATPLFERHASGMLLTEMGKCVLPRAQRAISELQRIPATLSRLKQRDHHREEAEPIWLFNVRRLQVFLRLYRLHHTQSVANSLGISQPAVSAALKVLEKGAGLSLFQRTPRGMMPSTAAREMAPFISRALNEIRHIPEDLAAATGILRGTVHVGALPLCRSTLLPLAITRLVATHPGIKIVTNESAFDALVTELRAGDIDFILGALRQDENVLDIQNQMLFAESLVLVVRPQHPLAGRQLSATDLTPVQWILPRVNSPARHLLDTAFQALGINVPTPMVESGDLAIVRGLLLNSDMVAAVSSHQLEYELTAGILRPLAFSLPNTRREIGLTLRQGALHAPAAEALIRCITDVATAQNLSYQLR
ncbi:LysR family transcriptional regulator [Pantoea cypripedii]|uniref:LysR family transcriptional regulator n=1 Tax=Pantoea cypripedii TaxID=55209 RepID=A0A1X1EHD8_PANCY|nr:LysR family transcriptional regulator [Pantoea cypripedii]MBP2199617.1 LysR family transcriptional regulator of gallate degradation [Pantoea cypripedii]ORM88253.1 LysR family transcriptional regulator [Pantoea cypripedii]